MWEHAPHTFRHCGCTHCATAHLHAFCSHTRAHKPSVRSLAAVHARTTRLHGNHVRQIRISWPPLAAPLRPLAAGGTVSAMAQPPHSRPRLQPLKPFKNHQLCRCLRHVAVTASLKSLS
eukprot:5010681-Pleurochrysis_carterae.AAC.1